MNISSSFKKTFLPGLIGSVLILYGCGGNDTNTDSSGAITSGIITGFGSIYVNGIKFETDTADFDVDDDNNATQDDLRIGMHVKINGTINPDGKTGQADKVTYENEVEGPVSMMDTSNPTQTLITILGLTITIDEDTTFDNDDNNLDMTSIMVGDVLEVSGYSNDGGLLATHIEKQNGSFTPDVTEIEIKGEIKALFTDNFTINGLDVMFDPATTEFDDIPNDTLVENLYVEVKGTLNTDGDLLTATKIEAEDDGLGDDADEVELEGMISVYDNTTKTFLVQGQTVDASGTVELIPSNLVLDNDIKVEVEGKLIDKVLYAEKIKLKGRKIKIHAAISSKDEDKGTVSFSLFGGTDNITVRVNTQTEMEDDLSETESFTLADLMPSDFVELEAFDDGTDTINAIELDRKETGDVKLEGPVSAFNVETLSVTLLGQSFTLPAEAEYENDDDLPFANATDFFTDLSEGSFIELTDKDPDGDDLPDGVIDEVELEVEDDN